MYLSSKSEGNKFLFSHDFAIFFFFFRDRSRRGIFSRSRQLELDHGSRGFGSLANERPQFTDSSGEGGETSAFGFHARFDQSILKSWEFQVGRFHRYARFMLMRRRLY